MCCNGSPPLFCIYCGTAFCRSNSMHPQPPNYVQKVVQLLWRLTRKTVKHCQHILQLWHITKCATEAPQGMPAQHQLAPSPLCAAAADFFKPRVTCWLSCKQPAVVSSLSSPPYKIHNGGFGFGRQAPLQSGVIHPTAGEQAGLLPALHTSTCSCCGDR